MQNKKKKKGLMVQSGEVQWLREFCSESTVLGIELGCLRVKISSLRTEAE